MACEDRVRVVVRVRPKQINEPLWVQVTDGTTLQTVNDRNRDEALQYKVSFHHSVKVHSHRAKEKAKIFFDMCSLFFDSFVVICSLSLGVNKPQLK